MKVYMTTDWHFGIYLNDLNKWINMMEDYFYNFYIPYLKKNVKEGDVLVHCGDLYDNRTSIPIIASYKVEKILSEIAKIMPIHLIVGNHDLYNKGSNDVNSVRLFDHIDNISVYTEAANIEIFDKKLILIPWVEKRLDLIKTIKDNPGDYLFCHSDLNGCRMHLSSVAHRNPDKIDIYEFKGYKHVFSGHIHLRQTNNNFTFIGAPYHMDRNDIGDEKGITILDIVSGEVEFVPNTYSPVFRKVIVKTSDDIDILEKYTDSKDYIDLAVSNNLLINDRRLRRKLEIMLESGGFTSVSYIDDIPREKEDDEDLDGMIDVSIQLDYEEFIREWIVKREYDSKFQGGILKEYDSIIEIYQDNYRSNV